MLASFAEGRVGGHGAGPFPKEGSAQKDAEQHGRGVQGRKQQRLCWSPAWLPPWGGASPAPARQGEGGGEQLLHPGGLTVGL